MYFLLQRNQEMIMGSGIKEESPEKRGWQFSRCQGNIFE